MTKQMHDLSGQGKNFRPENAELFDAPRWVCDFSHEGILSYIDDMSKLDDVEAAVYTRILMVLYLRKGVPHDTVSSFSRAVGCHPNRFRKVVLSLLDKGLLHGTLECVKVAYMEEVIEEQMALLQAERRRADGRRLGGINLQKKLKTADNTTPHDPPGHLETLGGYSSLKRPENGEIGQGRPQGRPRGQPEAQTPPITQPCLRGSLASKAPETLETARGRPSRASAGAHSLYEEDNSSLRSELSVSPLPPKSPPGETHRQQEFRQHEERRAGQQAMAAAVAPGYGPPAASINEIGQLVLTGKARKFWLDYFGGAEEALDAALLSILGGLQNHNTLTPDALLRRVNQLLGYRPKGATAVLERDKFVKNNLTQPTRSRNPLAGARVFSDDGEAWS